MRFPVGPAPFWWSAVKAPAASNRGGLHQTPVVRQSLAWFLATRIVFAIPIVAIWLLGLALPTQAFGDEEIDPGYCIIQPEEPASVEIFVDHNGQRVYFCCESCRRDFLSDPTRFDGTLSLAAQGDDQLAEWNGDNDAYANTFWGRIGRVVLAGQTFGSWCHVTFHLHDRLSLALALVSAAFMSFVIVRWLRSIVRRKPLTPHPLAVIAAVMVLMPCFYADRLRHQLIATQSTLAETDDALDVATNRMTDAEDRDMIHYATFLNFGDPPIPRPSRQMPSLRKTYYRGNDERSDEMPHGGNYRTVTFELWLEDASGENIDVGSRVVDSDGDPKAIDLVIRFVRSPDTSSGYFTDEYMQRMYVTMQSDPFLGRDSPVADRVSWRLTRKDREWVARYRLPAGILVREPTEEDFHPQWIHRLDDERPYDRGGVVYLCEDRFKKDRVIGGRFHYAVRYQLDTLDGLVTEGSDLWMQATYRGRNFAELQIEDDEWLSSDPIPER